ESVRPIFESAPDIQRVRPIELAHRHGPAMLLLHGDRDATVPSRQSDLFHDALSESGASVRKILYPGVGHIELILTLAPLYRWRAPVLRDVLSFLRPETGEEHAGPADTPPFGRAGARGISG